MAAKTTTLDGLKAYAVVAGDAADGELTMCLAAAKAYFANGGCEDPDESELDYPDSYRSLYAIGVYRLAALYYHHRTSDLEMRPIQSIIAQIAVEKELIGHGQS